LFTGIIEEIGTVARLWHTGQGYNLSIRANTIFTDTKLGDSIAVNGTCLTVTQFASNIFTVGLAPETYTRTNLKHLKEGDPVNLERALTPNTRMGGHFVQGHIDDVGTIINFRTDADALWVTIQATPELLRYVVPKGFIALDGVSLTVVDLFSNSFSVSVVAYTQQHIILPRQQIGYKINIEVDVLGKYVEKTISRQLNRPSEINKAFLARYGYK